MFTSEKIETFLQSVKFSGDQEKPALNLIFYKTPLDYDLCYELDHEIARQLYRKQGSVHTPILEFDDVGLKVPNIGGAFNLEWFPHNSEGADGAGQLTASCVIGKVEVQKLFSDKNEWSLIWHATIPLDHHSLELARKYFKKTVFLTLQKAQEEIPFQSDDKKPIVLSDADVECRQPIYCHVCNTLATYLAADQTGWCDPHVSRGPVGIQVRKIKYADGVTA